MNLGMDGVWRVFTSGHLGTISSAVCLSRPGRVVDHVRERDPISLAERRAMILKHLELQ